MKTIKNFLDDLPELDQLQQGLSGGHVLLSGVTPSFRPHLLTFLKEKKAGPLLVVTRNEHDGRKLYDQLVDLTDVEISPFLLDEFMTANVLSASSELRFERLQTLASLKESPNQTVITNVSALHRFLTPKDVLASAEISLTVGSIIEPEDLVKKALQLGYTRVSTVEAVGEFAVRGGIFDVFSKEVEHPVRIEFFDDEVETIRSFDVASQRSIEKIDRMDLTLLYEFYYEGSAVDRFKLRVKELLSKQLTTLDRESKETLETVVNKDLLSIESFSTLDLTHQYLELMYDEPTTLLDYLEQPTVVWLDAEQIAIHAQATSDEVDIWMSTNASRGELLTGFKRQADFDFNLADRQLFLSEQTHRLRDVPLASSLTLTSKSIEEYNGNLELFLTEVSQLHAREKTILISSTSADLRNILLNQLTTEGVTTATINPQKDKLQPGVVNVCNLDLEAGFELVEHKLIVYTDAEIQKNVRKKARAYQGNVRDGVRVKDHNELQLGDFVVHLQHGIGRYVGVETIDMLGIKRDVLTLEYKLGDRVYVPVDKIDLVQKYVGSEGAVPKLSRLGGKDWEKTKANASKVVKDIAKSLIATYAKRKYLPGHAFSKDGEMQQEFEALCPFVETEDQLKTTAEIKADMEQPHPMDRLLIGDVGYGKTEVAMRAAMKAVVDDKQVIYVAPTTILARQQHTSFKSRFAEFAVEIRILTRHATPKQISNILADVKAGKVDILIGTHRVLSKDVQFKDLGLLIVDEEQRFGVEHKESIKALKAEIDVLTLTATPIPRTLQMSMVGIRNLSLIETPPANRYPVQTYVLEAHDSVVRDGIERELARGGQVFYLHNRTSSLASRMRKIQKLVPHAKIAMAHGQMPRDVLEDTMQAFENREFDVLVCTTIIETGIDIPNANTLIVGDAYRLGLSQMYQLRGRVGRSDRIAYAYFLYPQNYVLTENSEKRLRTIREFTALGSGFKIAMRDLAIRGAGDMLGTRQNGFLDTVGLDLYTKMLAEAIKVAQDGGGEEGLSSIEDLTTEMLAASARELDIGVGIDRYIPDEYIHEASLKIEMYKKMKALMDHESYVELKLEFEDRFGTMPIGVENLVDLMYLKNLIKPVVASSRVTKKTLEFTLEESISANIDVKMLYKAASEIGEFVRVLFKDAVFTIVFDLKTAGDDVVSSAIRLFEGEF